MNVDKIISHLKIFRELKILCWKFLQINFLLYLSISFNQNIKTLWQKNQQRKQLRRLRKLLRRRSNQQSWYFQKGSNLGSLPFFFFISSSISFFAITVIDSEKIHRHKKREPHHCDSLFIWALSSITSSLHNSGMYTKHPSKMPGSPA